MKQVHGQRSHRHLVDRKLLSSHDLPMAPIMMSYDGEGFEERENIIPKYETEDVDVDLRKDHPLMHELTQAMAA